LNYYENIKFLVMDVDGTLTDGKIYMGDTGEALKAFDIKDGYGIKEILPEYGIIPVIITARSSNILKNRCVEIGIYELYQGCKNKLEKLKEIITKYSVRDCYRYTFKNIAYIGDDILDIPCMQQVKEAGGVSVCPINAMIAVRNLSDYICVNKCGDGAVREFIEWVVAMRTKSSLGLEQVKTISQTAYEFIVGFCPSTTVDGRYELEDGTVANVLTYVTKPVEMTSFEAHRKHIDIQFVVFGTELMIVQDAEKIECFRYSDYDEANDITLYNYNLGNAVVLHPSDTIILYPRDAHRGSIALSQPMKVRKIIVKIPVAP